MEQQYTRSLTTYSRRGFIKASALTAMTTGLWSFHALGSGKPEAEKLQAYRSKAMGCFMGAAIADAMGGPVECQHYERIAKYFPDFQDHLSYNMPPATFVKLKPGYALDEAPGSVTDDTFIRVDLARYVLANTPPYTASSFASWLVENADFSNWWGQAVKAVKRVQDGTVTPEEGGKKHKQGGGGAWWQPIAILYAADPREASAVTSDMCRIWKAPLEQDILSSVVAGQAAAFRRGATVDSVVNAVLDDSGPLAKKLFTRAIDIAAKASSPVELYENLYEHCLVRTCTTAVDGPMAA